MKKLFIILFITIVSLYGLTLDAVSKGKGDSCINDGECGFGLECNDGVCVKKKEFDYGSSGKSGKPCNIDADCIGSGECVKNSSGKGYCSGN